VRPDPTEEASTVNIDKSMIIDLLRQRGDNDKAEAADRELPGTVDTDRDGGLLERLGLDPQDLLQLVTRGGGGLGDLRGKLGF
jgi:hypothetical protein